MIANPVLIFYIEREIIMRLRPKSEHAKFVVMSSGRQRIILRHGHIAITDYRMGDNFAFEKYISLLSVNQPEKQHSMFKLKTELLNQQR